ncbi:MAG TPA: TIGR03936 family radical SAM-associated protein [Chthonomonadales bacterium]|nr:TIGR03936 family radical SAM-associated protein [Chthonomonadales bacterium]
MPKYLLHFEKREAVRWLGHLDLLRTFERAIRRSKLPIAFSAGYNPRERLVFASALGTGITGSEEPFTLELVESLDPEQIVQRLNLALPEGIRICGCGEVPPQDARAVLAAYTRGQYEVTCTCEPSCTETSLESAVDAVLRAETLPVARVREGKSKTVDIRPGIFFLEYRPGSKSGARCTFDLVAGIGERSAVKPAEVISALAVPGLTARRVHRVKLIAEKMADV